MKKTQKKRTARTGLSRSKRSIKTSTVPVGSGVYVLVEDITAGARNRYNLYRIALLGDKRAEIIGREITPGVAEKMVRESAFGNVVDDEEAA